jgi:hypothetical protein
MAGTDQHTELFPGGYQEPLPTTVNVLTILTFICSAFAFVSAFIVFAVAPFGYENAVRNQGSMDQLPSLIKSFIGTNQVEAARLQLAYRTPILLLTLAGVLLCFFGALQMRKLKKRGFTLYVLGDLLPLVSLIFFTNLSTAAGVGVAFSYGIALLFVILYATQLKYMK